MKPKKDKCQGSSQTERETEERQEKARWAARENPNCRQHITSDYLHLEISSVPDPVQTLLRLEDVELFLTSKFYPLSQPGREKDSA
ncbi:hypothetical protein RRG08_059609 [Elysia crispata]|uniref:Uncharacterized protein n=1 Tax=Elysia crispata TaxID=231223 RepID=A0AAE1E6N5_9GAST|nr:hypothetical protein RRG08_059609 [Elysia crispata]